MRKALKLLETKLNAEKKLGGEERKSEEGKEGEGEGPEYIRSLGGATRAG